MARLKVGVLVSGFGSNLQTLIDLCAEPDFPAEIVTVISNKPGVRALDRAARAGIMTHVIPHQSFTDRGAFDDALDSVLRARSVELICLAGFMRILTPHFVESWRDAIINVHPALLPAFRGRHTHRQALAAGVRFHGCTVHFVRPELDDGPILVQAVVPVLSQDDENSLAARVLQAEHRAYTLALRLIAEGRVAITGNLVAIAGSVPQTTQPMLNPPDAPPDLPSAAP